MGWLNVGSLLLGLIAWLLPVVSILDKRKFQKYGAVIVMMSFSACAISLYFQIVYNHHLVQINDWSALMDTTGAVMFAAEVLLIGTILLNLVTLVVHRNRTIKKAD